MARVSIPVTALSRAGVAPPAQTDADATNKNQLDSNDGLTWVEIVSTDAGSQTVGFEIPATVDGQSVIAKTVTVPAGATRNAGPWPVATYNQSGGPVFIDPSVSTTLKFRAYRLPLT
jgi:hypothetical protein